MSLNLHSIASQHLGGVGRKVAITVQISTGYQGSATGDQIPQYGPPFCLNASVQELTTGDLAHVNGLNQDNISRKVYITGHLHSVIRARGMGGDLLTFDGAVWLVTHVLESFSSWSSVVATQQVDPVAP